MIQREVALRICAAAGTADYGAFTVLCQYFADCELLYDVPPDCFYPMPKVTSSVIRMTVREKPAVSDPELLFKIVRAAFAQRRKTLQNALFTLFGKQKNKEELKMILENCGFPADIRGERLSLTDFISLTEKIRETIA